MWPKSAAAAAQARLAVDLDESQRDVLAAAGLPARERSRAPALPGHRPAAWADLRYSGAEDVLAEDLAAA